MTDAANLDIFNDDCFESFLKLTHKLTGITIASSRKSMVQGRLRKRVATLSLANYEAYLALVNDSVAEQIVFIDLITTNETYFFRTPRIWKHINEVYIPSWIASNPNKVFSAWSAAASSGEEAHSLGIALQAFKEKHPAFQYQVLGTDISREMVQLCQTGLYKGRSIEAFQTTKAELFSKYMKTSDATHYMVVPEIKTRLKFHDHNLFKILNSKDRFDLILLRNVLIYFTPTDQEKVLNNILPKLSENGILVIGESESLTHIKTGFAQVEPLVYRRSDSGLQEKKAA